MTAEESAGKWGPDSVKVGSRVGNVVGAGVGLTDRWTGSYCRSGTGLEGRNGGERRYGRRARWQRSRSQGRKTRRNRSRLRSRQGLGARVGTGEGCSVGPYAAEASAGQSAQQSAPLETRSAAGLAVSWAPTSVQTMVPRSVAGSAVPWEPTSVPSSGIARNRSRDRGRLQRGR